jgi:hypothetical protein
MNPAYCDGDIHTNDYDINKEIDAYKAQVAYAGELTVPKYIESPNSIQSEMITQFGPNAGLNYSVNHVYDIDEDFVWSIRSSIPNLIGRYENKILYSSW